MRDKKHDNRDSEVIDEVCNSCSTVNLAKSRTVSLTSFDRTGFKLEHKICSCQQTEQVLSKSRLNSIPEKLKNSVRPVTVRTVNKIFIALYPNPSVQSQQTLNLSNNPEARITIPDPNNDPNTETGNLCTCQQQKQVLSSSTLENSVDSDRSVTIPEPSTDSISKTKTGNSQPTFSNFRKGQTIKYFLTVSVVFGLLCILLLTNDTYGTPYFILLLYVYLMILCFLA